jgi:hypothetical protein
MESTMLKLKGREAVDFFLNGLCFHCDLLARELHDFVHYNRESELAWLSRSRDVEGELNSIIDRHPEVDASEIVESYAWDLHVNQMKYPGIHRESMTLSLCSFLEHELNSLCKTLLVSLDSKILLTDLDGKGVERAILCLKKVIGFDLSSMSSEIGNIRGVQLVRNHIVHNGGILPLDMTLKLNKFINRCKFLSGVPESSLQIDAGFVSFFIDELFSFFTKLDGEVQKFIQARIVDE